MAITKGTRGRISKNPGGEVLYRLYVTENKTAKEIAAMYGVSDVTVKTWLRNADPPKKT